MHVVVHVIQTLGSGLLTLLSLPAFWCVVLVICFESIVSMSCGLLKLLGCVVQQVFFGELRVPENNHGKDRLWNYVFYKFIFIFGVLNESQVESIISWAGWFALIGLVHLLTQICRDRIDYITFSAQLTRATHARLSLLLVGLFVVCAGLHVEAVRWAREHVRSVHFFLLCDAEVMLATVDVIYIVLRYSVHLWDIYHGRSWDSRAEFAYYSELAFQLASLTVDLAHDLHMLIFGNIFVSMASVAISMRLHATFTELKRRLTKHRHFTRISTVLSERYPAAKPEQLEDPCAICWEIMQAARVLPCSHIFHDSCLRSWLEQDTTCPTCRLQLEIEARSTKEDFHLLPSSAIATDVIASNAAAEAEERPLSHSNHNSNTNNNNNNGSINSNNNNNSNNDSHDIDTINGSSATADGPVNPGGNVAGLRDDARRAPPTAAHVFHFDGPRFLSWLPSVSVEVSHSAIPQEEPTALLQLSVDVAESEDEADLKDQHQTPLADLLRSIERSETNTDQTHQERTASLTDRDLITNTTVVRRRTLVEPI